MEKIWIRYPGWEKFGSGINIPDPQHCIYGLGQDPPLLGLLSPDPDPEQLLKQDGIKRNICSNKKILF
jgi:hypothetical protein